MPAQQPTILATSGGVRPSRRHVVSPGPLLWHALELGGGGDRPKLCYLGTAGGDDLSWQAHLFDAFSGTGVEVSCLRLFPMPSVPDLRAHLLAQDVVWVGGGSVAGLLAMWRLHGLDEIFREVWEAGVVLSGVSAGSLCWHVGGTTDSFGPELRPVTDGLALVPYANGVHYDAEPQRRPLLQKLVGDGTLPGAYATDNGVGLLYCGAELVEAVSEVPGAGAYSIRRAPAGVVEERIEPRLLPEPPPEP
ncbi:MAG: Type 1 glutamine amidotransferase-like domain-containing protein [Candidatus Dormibacteraceae bacterium]